MYKREQVLTNLRLNPYSSIKIVTFAAVVE